MIDIAGMCALFAILPAFGCKQPTVPQAPARHDTVGANIADSHSTPAQEASGFVVDSGMAAGGLLYQVDRGLYRLADAPVTELSSLAEVSKRVPSAVICLLSALQVHGLSTEDPSKKTQWSGFIRKANVRDDGTLAEAIAVVRAFVEAPLAAAKGAIAPSSWSAGGPVWR